MWGEREKKEKKKISGVVELSGFSSFEIRLYSVFDFSKKNFVFECLSRNFDFQLRTQK